LAALRVVKVTHYADSCGWIGRSEEFAGCAGWSGFSSSEESEDDDEYADRDE
jgi:hypothetical protein